VTTTIKNRNSSLHVGSGVLLEAVRRLQPLLRQEAAAGEELGQLTPKVVDALHENGLFGMWLPAQLGGSELTPLQSLTVLEELAYGDASTAWVVMAACLAIGSAGAYLPTSAAETLFPPNRKRLNVITGQGTRSGKAVTTEGGYLVSGSWSFGSGLKHSTYIHTAAIIQGTGEPTIFILPIEKAKLIDNWDVIGLRATGSIDYTLDNVFVPEDFTHSVLTLEPKRGGGLYRIGIINFAGICHAGWALGVGRRMLDDLRELAKAKVGRAAQNAANDSFQQAYGLAEAKLRAARAFVFETWTDHRGNARPRRAALHAAGDPQPPCALQRDLDGERCERVCLQGRGYQRAATRPNPALFSGHARRHAARHLVAGRPAGLRSGAGGARRG
jgi:alkylation response protein AidB-like acyl-CoA dehydrogenase